MAETTSRRALVLSGAAAVLAPRRAGAETAVPTFSLKGLPGLSAPAPKCSADDCSAFEEETKGSFSLQGLLGGNEDPPPLDLGVFGRGPNKEKSGKLNRCVDPAQKDGAKKGCISTFDNPLDESFVPAWTYQPGYSQKVISASEARRQALRAEAGLEPAGADAAPTKSKEVAFQELKAAVQAAGGKIVVEEDRYLRAEFTEGNVVDDVEWLISLDLPLVNYRSAPRRGGDDKRQRNRIRDIRKGLTDKGWKSVGRQLEGI